MENKIWIVEYKSHYLGGIMVIKAKTKKGAIKKFKDEIPNLSGYECEDGEVFRSIEEMKGDTLEVWSGDY